MLSCQPLKTTRSGLGTIWLGDSGDLCCSLFITLKLNKIKQTIACKIKVKFHKCWQICINKRTTLQTNKVPDWLQTLHCTQACSPTNYGIYPLHMSPHCVTACSCSKIACNGLCYLVERHLCFFPLPLFVLVQTSSDQHFQSETFGALPRCICWRISAPS